MAKSKNISAKRTGTTGKITGRTRSLAEAKAQDPMFYINKTGFEKYREELLENGFDPSNPADMSMCEWLVHSWNKND
ncbi:hypothetical protein [Fimbriiglobus ruber]|uniref:Uncharacterized protein n=1 Tax=Fimbriiglobus ruber TaxID=1908690 RepID=A0A225E4C6_9BACT|nr:hypothetical protein [Fimbriiglobus ruber]OWK46604.1 hypothetical protein FRUB_00303 [Fimbriiglobus ruber]